MDIGMDTERYGGGRRRTEADGNGSGYGSDIHNMASKMQNESLPFRAMR